MKRIVFGTMLALLLISMLASAFDVRTVRAEPKTWYVDDSGGADFAKIQDAVIAASPGDTIYVYNGTYYEHVSFGKSLTLIGENKNATIIDGSGWGDAVKLSYASGVKLAELTMRNAQAGIYLYNSNNNTIVSNIVANCGPSGGGCIFLNYYSVNNTVADNTILNTTEVGILITNSYNNIVADNTISNITRAGIRINYYNNIVAGNTISDSTEPAIFLEDHSHDNTIRGNSISNSATGIYVAEWSYNNNIVDNIMSDITLGEAPYGINVWSSQNNKIIGNIMTNIGYTGIRLNSLSDYPNTCANNVVSGNNVSHTSQGIAVGFVASSNTVDANNVSDNDIGLFLFDQSDNNTLVNNVVSNNNYGIALFSSNDSKIYHNNFIDNIEQVLLSESFNTAWDNGYPSGGNYWSDYAGPDFYSGPDQNIPGSDGIGDTPYIIDVDNGDRYPLMTLYVGIHDSVVTGVMPSKIVVGEGYSLNINVTAANQGDYTETFNVTVFANETIIETKEVTLTSGDFTIITFTWNTAGFAKGNYTVSAVADIVLRETDTTNNGLTDGKVCVGVPGDLNADGTVDVFDAVLLSGAAGSEPGDGIWNPNADINNDNIVDLFDAVILAGHAGEHYP